MERPILAARRFWRTWSRLDARQHESVIDVILGLPDLLGRPHAHRGAGLRRLHGSDFWEARLDRRWRLIMQMTPHAVVLFDVMNHDEVRRLT